MDSNKGLKSWIRRSFRHNMATHNYDIAGKNARIGGGINTHGSDMYKSSFTGPREASYVWSDRAQSLSEILKEEKLPLVVKLCNDNVVKSTESSVDLQRPLLLYKEVKGRKLHGRNLRTKPAVRDVNRVIYQTVGPWVIFSESFPGFFKEIESRNEPLQHVSDVARLMPLSFQSSDPCDGYQCVDQIEGNLWQKTTLPPGLYRPLNLLEETITYLSKRKSEKKKLVRCLKCADEKGKTVLFLLEGNGRFYIAEPGSKFSKYKNIDSACRIFKWTEFDPARIQGLRVTMMHGNAPHEECQFTGLVEVRHVAEEDTVIGTTMTSTPRMFEMAVTSEPFFMKALNSDDLDSETIQQKCLKFARTECESYIQAIKVRRDYDIDQANGIH